MHQLDSKAIWLFFFQISIAVLWVGIFLGGWGLAFLVPFALAHLFDSLMSAVIVWIILLCVFFVLIFLFAYIVARLTYHFYRYELREDGFRKEHGIIWKKYVTIPYGRIQNVDIHRGIIERLLGLSRLKIQTAGATYGGRGAAAEGILPGVSKQRAEALRDELVDRARNEGQSRGGL